MATGQNAANIPVIDLSAPSAAAEILEAASTYGFVYVKNNELGIPSQDIHNMFELVDEPMTPSHVSWHI
jgi:hypothetical protein